jgi:cobalt-zinc-cadmium resistance protein CzcA
LLGSSSSLRAQPARISFADAYSRALSGNLQLRSSDVAVQRGRMLAGTALLLPKTGFFAENEDARPSDSRGILKIGVSQSFEWPGVYSARKALFNEQAKSLVFTRQTRALEIRKNLQTAYYTLWYYQSRQQLWRQLDSMYGMIASAALLRVRKGESAGLDSIAAGAKSAEIRVQLAQLGAEMQIQQSVLRTLLNTDSIFLPEDRRLERVEIPVDAPDLSGHPALLLQRQSIAIADADLRIARRSVLPDFSGRFFSQRLYGLPDPFSGFSVSVGVPLFGMSGYRARLRAASLERDYQESVLSYESQSLQAAVEQSRQRLEKDLQMLSYYESAGLAQAAAILRAANLAYRGGEISFAELSAFLTQAVDIQRNYLEALNQYNQSAIALGYYINR